MHTEFQDRLAVITGASSGIGLALCAALLPRGVKVLAMSRTVGELPTLQQIYGGRLQWRAGDVTCQDDLRDLAEQANARLTAIKFAGYLTCQVAAGTRSVFLESAFGTGSPWTVSRLANIRSNPSTNR